MNCKNCGKDISDKPQNKYCSRSCAAKINNKGVRRHGEKPKPCKVCGKDTRNSKSVYCSHKCRAGLQRSKVFDKIKKGQYDLTWSGNPILRSFLVEERGCKCGGCGLEEWMGLKIPLSVHHKDGNAANNHPSNLELLCLNCHGITPNFGRKNTNGSRKYRYKPS